MTALTRWSRGDKVTSRPATVGDCSTNARASGCWHVVRAESTAAARLARVRPQPRQQQQDEAMGELGEAGTAAGSECGSAALLRAVLLCFGAISGAGGVRTGSFPKLKFA